MSLAIRHSDCPADLSVESRRAADNVPLPALCGTPGPSLATWLPVQRPSHDFDAIYASETPPAWDIGRPQPAFDRLAKAGVLVGSVLDPGCGTGEHALLAASLGHEVVGVHLSAKPSNSP